MKIFLSMMSILKMIRKKKGLKILRKLYKKAMEVMVVWVLFPKYEVLEDPPILEHLVEPKGEDCFQVLPFVLPPMHDIQVVENW